VVGDHDDGVVCKKGKAPDGFTAGAMDTRADCGLSEENTQCEGDPEMTSLEDITAGVARKGECDWLRSSDPQLQDTAAPQQFPDEIGEPTIRDPAEQPGTWDSADILRVGISRQT
jgi:hypothetical protein